MLEIPRRKLLGMTMAVFGFFTTLSKFETKAFMKHSITFEEENLERYLEGSDRAVVLNI
jgi:predicted transcriptional regulator